MKRVVIAGATGLIGRHLADALIARGDDVVVVSRASGMVAGRATLPWDARRPLPPGAVDGADAIVNLAGEPIGGGRWTADRRRRILESRLTSTSRCVEALGGDGPRVLVNASAVGYYGSGDTPVDESAPPGTDFLADVCVQWEDAARRGEDVARVVRVRSGIVLAADGGALPRLLQIARLGAAGPLGSGQQWLPWIHIDDEVATLLACIDSDALHGPVNAVAPEPSRQRAFMRELARLVHRPSVLPTPAPLLRLVLGDMSDLLLTGQCVVPEVLRGLGVTWRFPTLQPALQEVIAT